MQVAVLPVQLVFGQLLRAYFDDFAIGVRDNPAGRLAVVRIIGCDLHLAQCPPQTFLISVQVAPRVRVDRDGIAFEELDLMLSRTADNWSLTRMVATDRNVLRLGAFEILYTDTPDRVAINEAVDLAKRYGTAQSGPFVNGILDKFLVHHRGEEAEEAT